MYPGIVEIFLILFFYNFRRMYVLSRAVCLRWAILCKWGEYIVSVREINVGCDRSFFLHPLVSNTGCYTARFRVRKYVKLFSYI